MRFFEERLAGWNVTVVASLAVVAMFVEVLAAFGSDEAGVRVAVRATARSSLALFSLAFAASALRRLWPNPVTAWLRRNRRYLGVAFGVSLAVHGVSLILLATLPDTTFEPGASTMLVGGLAYAFTAAMVATSTDRSAAWLSPRAWRRLHTTGAWYVWFVFTATLAPVAPQPPARLFEFATCLALAALRLVARRRARAGA
jgi:hypothetical protein